MDPSRLGKSEKAQHDTLCKISRALWRHGNRSKRVRNIKLESLGIVKSTPLEIDDPAACDLDCRFFEPNYKDEHLTHALGADDPEYVAGIMETGQQTEAVWGETFSPRDPDDDDDWFPPCPEQLPAFRFMWFACCLEDMQQVRLDRREWWEDKEDQERHESRT